MAERNQSIFFVQQTGCLLPFLIVFNLFFGWMFFRPLPWLLIEVVLVLLFILNVRMMIRKIFSSTAEHGNVIDTEGEVVEEKKKLK